MTRHAQPIKDKDFQALAELLPDFIARYEVDGRFIYLNESLRKALNVTLEEVIGRLPHDIWPDGRFSLYLKKIINCAQTGDPDYLDLKVPDVNGNPVEYHHIRFVAERDLEGNIISVIAFGRDMTQRILLEQQLTASSRMASLGEMAGGIAHEVNNPLAIIYGKVRRLEKLFERGDYSKESVLKITADIEMTLHRISRIVKGLQTFSREGSKDPFNMESIQEIIKDALAFCEQRIKYKGIELQTTNLFESSPLMVECRSTEISQVFVNLLNNAYDAVEGTESAWIRIDVMDLGDQIELAVTDSGKSIDPDHYTKIMHPFFTTKPVGKGTGLGLSLSKGIIDTHHGRFFLDTESKNTRFVVQLPKNQKMSTDT